MAILFKNNAASTLTYKMTDAQEVLYVADASVFPVITPDSGDTFKLTLVGDDTLEIVEAFEVYNPEGRQGFKIRRAQEGTPAQAWPVDTRVEMRITAGALDSFVPTAVQIAKDNVDAIGVASTTNVGFAGVDGQTTQADAGGVITVKDVAIGGDLGDLASARGQIGDPAIITSPDYNTLLKSGLYHCYFDGAQNGPGNFSTKLHVIARGNHIVQVAYQSSAPGIFMRTSGDGGALWSAWSPAVTTNRVGDGIRVTKGIISVPEMQGATASKVGTSGLVPPAAAGQHESFLTGGGEYKPVLTKISDSVNLADSKTAASAKAVKAAYDLANSKQPNLGFTPVQQGGGAEQNTTKVYLGWSVTADALKAQVANVDLGNIVTTAGGCTKAPSATRADTADTAKIATRADTADTAKIATRADTADTADSATEAKYLLNTGNKRMYFDWATVDGTPTRVWGTTDGQTSRAYNPSNFSVNYANSAHISTAVSGVWFGRNNQTVPSGGTWRVITSINGKVDFMTVAGGTSIPHDWWYAVRVA